MEKAVAYTRVSSLSQVDRYGLPVQEREVKACAKSQGVRLIKVFRDEGVSGSLEAVDRPGLAEALSAIEGGEASVLVVPRLDRLARRLTIQEAALAQVWRHGGRVISYDQGEVAPDDPNDPMRTAMRQMMGVFGQLERAMIVARLRKGREAKARAGGFAFGAPPFGFKAADGMLAPDEDEQRTIRLAQRLRRNGASLRQIASTLTESGIASKRGGKWHPATVARLLDRAA